MSTTPAEPDHVVTLDTSPPPRASVIAVQQLCLEDVARRRSLDLLRGELAPLVRRESDLRSRWVAACESLQRSTLRDHQVEALRAVAALFAELDTYRPRRAPGPPLHQIQVRLARFDDPFFGHPHDGPRVAACILAAAADSPHDLGKVLEELGPERIHQGLTWAPAILQGIGAQIIPRHNSTSSPEDPNASELLVHMAQLNVAPAYPPRQEWPEIPCALGTPHPTEQVFFEQLDDRCQCWGLIGRPGQPGTTAEPIGAHATQQGMSEEGFRLPEEWLYRYSDKRLILHRADLARILTVAEAARWLFDHGCDDPTPPITAEARDHFTGPSTVANQDKAIEPPVSPPPSPATAEVTPVKIDPPAPTKGPLGVADQGQPPGGADDESGYCPYRLDGSTLVVLTVEKNNTVELSDAERDCVASLITAFREGKGALARSSPHPASFRKYITRVKTALREGGLPVHIFHPGGKAKGKGQPYRITAQPVE